MGDNVFPETVVGICPVCGGDGGDDPNPGSAFATPTNETANGYELVLYEGEYMCPMCRKRKIQHAESRVMSDAYQEGEEFRSRAGFRRTMED